MREAERQEKLNRPVTEEEFTHYRAYIQSGYWEARKELYFERNPKKCAVCDSSYVDLHHMFYGDYGQETDADLIPLCRRDHEALHLEIGGARKDMREATRRFVARERLKLAHFASQEVPLVPSEPERSIWDSLHDLFAKQLGKNTKWH